MNIRSTQRNMKAKLETRQAQMFMQIYGKWSEGDFSSYWFDLSDTVWTDYGKFKENLLENHGEMKSLSVLIRFFEGLAERSYSMTVPVDPAACALSVRVHRCPLCGLTLDRDVNAVLTYSVRGLGWDGESTLVGEGVSTQPGAVMQVPSMNQEATLLVG
jgi:hypothetical protein